MNKQLELVYEETKRSHDKIADLINSYDRRINYTFVMATTLLGIFMLFLSFIFSIFENIDVSNNPLPLDIIFPWMFVFMILSFVFCLGGLWFTLIPCINALRSQKLSHVVDPTNIFSEYKNKIKSSDDLVSYLINKNYEVYEQNLKRANFMMESYEKSLNNLKVGTVSFIIFSILSFILLVISSYSPTAS